MNIEMSDRINSLLTSRNMSAAELSRALGKPKATISGWTKKGVVPGGENMNALAKALSTSTHYLLTGKGPRSPEESLDLSAVAGGAIWGDETPLDDDDIAAPFYTEAQLAAGNGHASDDGRVRSLRFSSETLRREGIEPENVIAIKVRGNSMEPDIPDGATVAIDTAATDPRAGKEYAVVTGDLARIKCVTKLRGGGLRLHSINESEHPDEIIEPHEMGDVRIVGKVFWVASLRR